MCSKVEAGLDLGGEKGEYHTMVIDGPLYTSPVVLQGAKGVKLEGQEGQKSDEVWWVLEADTS